MNRESATVLKTKPSLNRHLRVNPTAFKWGGTNNEELEHLGDTILNSIVTVKAMCTLGHICQDDAHPEFKNTFITNPGINEGALTNIREGKVNNLYLAERIDCLGFAKFITMGSSDVGNGLDKNPSEKMKANIFEAIIGAAAIDSDRNLGILEKVVTEMLDLDTYLNCIRTGELPIPGANHDNN